jgi:hypothetical protein
MKLKNPCNCIRRQNFFFNDTWVYDMQAELNRQSLGYIFNKSSIAQKILKQRFFFICINTKCFLKLEGHQDLKGNTINIQKIILDYSIINKNQQVKYTEKL